MRHLPLATICLVILTTVVVFSVLHSAKNVFAPIISALLLGVILTPVSDLWDRFRLPPRVVGLSVRLSGVAGDFNAAGRHRTICVANDCPRARHLGRAARHD